jgi:hypothetical protein
VCDGAARWRLWHANAQTRIESHSALWVRASGDGRVASHVLIPLTLACGTAPVRRAAGEHAWWGWAQIIAMFKHPDHYTDYLASEKFARDMQRWVTAAYTHCERPMYAGFLCTPAHRQVATSDRTRARRRACVTIL